ncbi:MAG: hypothetical protein Q9222_005637 [Ikaeria aurantiellina]
MGFLRRLLDRENPSLDRSTQGQRRGKRKTGRLLGKTSLVDDFPTCPSGIESIPELDDRHPSDNQHVERSASWEYIASPALPLPRKLLIRHGQGFKPEGTQDIYELPGAAVEFELDGTLIDNNGTVDIANHTEIDATTSYNEASSDESCDELSEVEDGDTLDDGVLSNTHKVYKGLELATPQFRLLSLQPARNMAEDIHCHLVNDDPRSKPAYEALSYTWGETKERRIIFVNGEPFPVTPNLFVALQYLRQAEGSRVLWIDAICIDQCSLSEKTHQVGMMKEIYREASRVLMWLGESDRDIRRAMTFLKRRRLFQLLTEDELDPFIPGLTKIFERPWWSRIWVVQEILVATKPPLLGCGRKWLSWEDLSTGMANLRRQQRPGAGTESYLKNPMAFYDLGFMSSALTHRSQTAKAVLSEAV